MEVPVRHSAYQQSYSTSIPVFTERLSVHATSHPGQLSLLLSAGWELSTGQGAVTALLSWEGSHRSSVALTMRHRLSGVIYITLVPQWTMRRRRALRLYAPFYGRPA